MSNADSRITIHMAASLDGFIARADGRTDWMETSDTYEGGVEMDPAFIQAFLKSIDCYVMGSRTYETALAFEAKGLGWAYGDKPAGDFKGPRKEYGDRPKRSFGDKPKGDFSDRPKRPYTGRPAADGADRPKRPYGAKPAGSRKEFGDKPKRPRGSGPGGDRPRRPRPPKI